MRLSAASWVIIVAAFFNALGAAKAESDLSSLAGTFWRIERLDSASSAIQERSGASIAAMVRRGLFQSTVVHISHETIDFHVPGGGVRGWVFGHDSSPLEIGRCYFGRPSFAFANGFVLDAVEAELPRITGYVGKADVLELLDNRSRPVLALSRINATGLENREWSIDQYFDGANLVTAPQDSAGWVTFVNNSFGGTPGCCGFSGTYNLSDTRLRAFGFFCFSGGYCTEQQESATHAIIKALKEELIVERDGQRISLRNDHGTVQIVLRPRDG